MQGQAQDLPNPPANLQTMPTGSYIIAMDTTYQLNGALFNLKAYGLVTYLLYNNVKLKWVIRAGKVKDAADFTVNSTQLKPTLNSTVTSRAFAGGPFVVYAPDTTGVGALIDGFYTSAGLAAAAKPKVYVSTQNVTVDMRYDLSGFKPYAAILNDGGNAAIHTAFMTAASIPTASYYVSFGTSFQTICATFASEPHNNSTTVSRTDSIVLALRTFAYAGGNILFQCAAIPYYENSTNGYLQSTGGVTTTNLAIGITDSFPNADLSFSQVVGVISASQGGSVQNWQINGSGSNSVHGHVFGFSPNNSIMASSVSKLLATTGGLVFYLGSHNYSTTNNQNINGIRMYLNAFLTPSIMVCIGALPVKLINFEGRKANELVSLNWEVQQNEDCSSFEVEASKDSKSFYTIRTLSSTDVNGRADYEITIPDSKENNFYRLKMISRNQGTCYSKILKLSNANEIATTITLQGNPVHDQLSFTINGASSSNYSVYLYNTQGVKIYESLLPLHMGSIKVEIPLRENIPTGILILEVNDTKQTLRTKIVKN